MQKEHHVVETEGDVLRQEITALVQGARAVLQFTDFAESARSIFDQCKEMTGATAGYIALLDEEGAENKVLFLDAGGLPCTVDPDLPMPIRGLRSICYKTGKAVYDNDFMNSEWVNFMPGGHVFLKNVMFAPLILDKKAVGLIGLANKDGEFNDNDARISTIFGELASIALRNSLVEEEKRHVAEELEKSHDALTKKHKELQVAQMTIIHQEKMATIGQIAAGVAHAINNPMGFIISNLHSVSKYADKLQKYLSELEVYVQNLNLPAENLRGFSALQGKYKISRIISDMEDIAAESLEGA